ncbi:MAG TPA: RNA methyltransferase [Bdellovibrionales bacterium]|nr:RNA methyltransferase [Bdellovibrionales bacterium]
MKRKPEALIESRQNPKFKTWLSLLDSKGLKRQGQALVSGEKLVQELLRDRPEMVRDILLPPKATRPNTTRPNITRLSGPLFNLLDVLGTKSPLAVIQTPAIPDWEPEPPRGLELVVALGDPANLGALLRSAEAFGVTRVILTREAASPFLPKALKASALSSLRVKLARTAKSLAELELENAFGLDMDGESLTEFTWPEDMYLVLGEEGQGLPGGLEIKRLSVPMAGKVESLNATIAASLALYSRFISAR